MRRAILSIVTVNYNNRDQLFQTIESVTYWRSKCSQMLEYIIIDGGSDDLGGSDLARLREVSDIFICEQDDGIYDAMNKGLRAASGEYIYFLNSGDMVIDLNVILEKIQIDIANGEKAVLAFRSLQIFGNIGWEWPVRSLLSQMETLCAHQATVVPLAETRGIQFDVSRPISSDSLWMRECIRARSVKLFSGVVAIFRLGGISNRATFSDQMAIYKDHPSLKRLWALILKPILLMMLGYERYYRVIYVFKHKFVPDVDRYLREHVADSSFLKKVNLVSATRPPR